MKGLLHVFPDTMVFLHYRPLSQIDWRRICDASTVHLVICMQVIHELDTKKGDSRFAGRAERAIKEIRNASDTGDTLREGVTLSIFDQVLRQSDFSETLSPDWGDDRIVHLVQRYRDQNSGREVAIATGDYGMELRCKASGVQVVQMDTALRLPNPQGELEKKHKHAVAELNQLKNRLPDLVLHLAASGEAVNKDQVCAFELCNTWQPTDIEAELTKIREKHPLQAGLYASGMKIGAIPPIAGTFVNQSQWQQYDEELDAFYTQYREHLQYLNKVRAARTRSILCDLWLYNNGNGMANNIDVIVNYPSSICWLAKSDSKEALYFEKDTEPPKPPERPQPHFAAIMQRMHDLNPSFLEKLKNIPIHHDEWTPRTSVSKDDGSLFEIHARIGKLKHGHNVLLGNFIAVFSSWEDVKPFQTKYTITTSDLHNKVVGNLPVKAKVAPFV